MGLYILSTHPLYVLLCISALVLWISRTSYPMLLGRWVPAIVFTFAPLYGMRRVLAIILLCPSSAARMSYCRLPGGTRLSLQTPSIPLHQSCFVDIDQSSCSGCLPSRPHYNASK